MKSSLLIVFLCSLTFPAQRTELWQDVPTDSGPVQLKSAIPGPAQLVIIRKALKARGELDIQCADPEDGPQWFDKVLFRELPISETEKALLVEAGEGCARGAQGSNGAMWVARFSGDKLSFLATPEQKFEGWLYSVQSTTSHGLRDLVLGWHRGGAEVGLGYFRFDGNSYRQVGTAVLVSEDGTAKIVPDR